MQADEGKISFETIKQIIREQEAKNSKNNTINLSLYAI
jgi:hypothetical protein